MRLIITTLLLYPLILFSQANLVPNSSFEQCINCPTVGFGQIGVQFAPYNVDVIGWFNPNANSPDYFYNLTTIQTPHTDSAYVGLATFDPAGSNTRDYISCTMLDSLLEDTYYWVEFFTSVAEGLSSVASNNLGIHFSDTALQSTTPLYFDVNAQIKYFTNEVIDDTLNWVKVCGLYKAHGGEQFLTIGNFNTDAETTEGMNFNLGFDWQTYFLIDDVSVIPLDSIPGGIPVDAGPDKTIYIGDTAFIGQKISNMPDNWFLLNGTPVDTNTAGVYVSPSVNTTYVVIRNLNGFYSTDTVTVFVNGLGLEEVKKERYSLFPVPNNGYFHLNGNIPSGSRLLVQSLDGKVLFEEHFTAPTKNFEVNSDLKVGTYFVVLETENGEVVFRDKVIVMK
jgi:hypothetical protein